MVYYQFALTSERCFVSILFWPTSRIFLISASCAIDSAPIRARGIIFKCILDPHLPFRVHISRWRINTLHYHRFVIIDSVDKRFKLNRRSMDRNINSGNQKHERHDPPCFNLPSWSPSTMHAMRGSSERNHSSYFYIYNPQRYQLSMALSRRITLFVI